MNALQDGTLEVLAGSREVHERAAELFAEALRDAVAERGRFSVALSGGTTPLGLYERLVRPPYDGLRWDRVHFFWGDERCVPPDHPDSNFGSAGRALLAPIGAAEGRVHRIRGELPPEEAARAYEEELRRVLGGDPRLDLVLLGVGTDGHTASLFPGSSALDDERWVAACYVDKLGAHRVTLTPAALNRARQVVFLAVGEPKAPAVLEARRGGNPAGRVRPDDGSLVWLVDEAAAGRRP